MLLGKKETIFITDNIDIYSDDSNEKKMKCMSLFLKKTRIT